MTGDAPILAAYNTASMKSMESTTWITIVLVVIILLVIYRSPVSPSDPPGYGRARLSDLPRIHRLPGAGRPHHLHVHQRVLGGGAVRGRHRLLPVPHQPLPRGDDRRRHDGARREDHRARRRRDHRLQRRHGDRGPGHDGLRRAGPLQHQRAQHRHRGGDRPAGRADPHPRAADDPGPPHLLAAQSPAGQGTWLLAHLGGPRGQAAPGGAAGAGDRPGAAGHIRQRAGP